MHVNELYAPLIERETGAFPAVARAFLAEHGDEALFLAAARFAVLAYSPSQHGKHAVLACLAAYQLREELGPRFADLSIECAIYAAQSRQPWSEPPILTPPPLGTAQRGEARELREAIAARDRLRAERWLAARLDDPELPRDLFAVAAEEVEGDSLSVSVAAWSLVPILGEKGKYATLRLAVWECAAAGPPPSPPLPAPPLDRAAAERLITRYAAERGAVVAALPLFVLDVRLEAAEILGASRSAPPLQAQADDVPVYRLARDYATCLRMHALAKRMRTRLPGIDMAPALAAARANLDSGPSFADWA
ncbi:MAG: hypothetical protein JWN02_656 [Acidobacteria bacterium]|nr:hypothetical protein [Acidobacteriota bacterium]